MNRYATRCLRSAALVMAALACANALGQSPQGCLRIADPQARLECFEQLFSEDDGDTAEPEQSQKTHEPESASPPPNDNQAVTSESPVQPPPPAQTVRKHSERGLLARMFERRPEIHLTSTIAAIRRRDNQKMVFRLDNGEIWMQVAPRDQPFRTGETVTITSTLMGGYVMRGEGGTATRVSRIR